MAPITPELRAAIDVAKQRITVDDYYTKAVASGLSGHAKGYLGGVALGMFTGALGAVCCIGALMLANIALPIAAGALMLGAIGVGASIGGVVGSRVGSSAGTVAAAFAERERRDKAEKLEQEILQSPEKQNEVIAAYERDPIVKKGDTVAELYATHTRSEATKKLLDVKTMLFAGLICAVAGALVCAGAYTIAVGGFAAAAEGISLGWGALSAASVFEAGVIGAGLGAASGITFGIGYPAILGTLAHRSADLLSGKMVRGKSGFGHLKNIPEVEQEMLENHTISAPLHPHVLGQAADLPRTHIQQPILAERPLAVEQQLGV